LEAEEKVVGYEHGWQQKSQNDGFSFFGFAKNERANISDVERESLQSLGTRLLSLSVEDLKLFCEDGSIMEISHGH
jgi:hypothetical protein